MAQRPAVPFLIRLTGHREVPGRARILELLGQFACLQNTMVEPWKSKPEALACRSALYGAFDVFCSLLDEEDLAIRAGAAGLLVEFVDRADDVVDEFRGRYAVEADPGARVEVVWFIARLAAAVSKVHRLALQVWLETSTPPHGDPVRLAFLVALRRIDPAAVPYRDMLGSLDSARPPGEFTDPVGWIEQELVDKRAARLILARRAIDRAVRTGDPRGMASPGAMMMKWRFATAELVPVIGDTLHSRRDIAGSALHLLAAAGELSRPYINDIAAKVEEPGKVVA